ncbi:hypothetical protein AnigIFM56816_005267 [Aspergillus niger]|nr:hypothetical protein AnigIFM56816_005267 [Aspergillus niger]
MDNLSDCTLTNSRRGTYDRMNARLSEAESRLRAAATSLSSPPRRLHPDQTDPPLDSAGAASAPSQAAVTREDGAFNIAPTNLQDSSKDTGQSSEATPAIDLDLDLGIPPDAAPSTQSATSTSYRSLSSMFEDFLGQRGHEGVCKAKLVLFDEPSPLTFALHLRKDMDSSLHDASQHVLNSDSLTVIEENVHPKHLSPHDLEYLKARGVFIFPETRMLEEIITVFLDRFYPLYSVVNPKELRKAQQEQKIPWILLHSICFIAMTFCEPAMIYKAGFSSRADARQLYYDRAKALFDLNYENNKIILVKVAILLSFRGPQMDCYWNPCSWIEFGVTMAVALGMHRKSILNNEASNDRGLLRRLWWTLAIRDAHCSALLGRPFRINISQCDIDMLTLDDFPDGHSHSNSSSTSQPICDCCESFEYQVQVAKLSLILRNIMHFRFGPISEFPEIVGIQEQLSSWKAQLPAALQCVSGQLPMSITAVYLNILLNYHIMLLYMDRPRQSEIHRPPPATSALGGYDSVISTESAALEVSSSAIKLMIRSSMCAIPHEVFPGFFVAGIILYQQAQDVQRAHLARMVRASFDNCQMLLNQAQNTWDPGVWAMKVFEFLFYAVDRTDAADAQKPPNDSYEQGTHIPSAASHTQQYSFPSNQSWSDVPSSSMEFGRHSSMYMADYMLLPNFFTVPFGS